MDDTATTTVREPTIARVTEEHHIARARRVASVLAEAIGFHPLMTACVVTSVSELAANLFLHATRGGTIALVPTERNGETGIEVVAEDRGPGIPDVEMAMQEGFSTGDGMGCGLPGVRRLMDEMEIESTVGVGTRVVTRKWLPCR